VLGLVSLPLFCDVTLAARIERAESRFMAECTRAAGRQAFAHDLAGGVASYAEPDSPFNKIAGLGFAPLPSAADLDAAERAFAAVGAPVQAEVSTLADPRTGDLLTARGYRLVSFENVLGHPLTAIAPHGGVEIRRSGDDEFADWLELMADAVADADTQGVPSHEEFPRDTVIRAMRDMASAGVQRYAALRDGRLAGGAGMRIADGVAQLTGAATATAHRRRGIQTALLAARLADAAEAGCDIAVVTTQPGSKSQQNVQRLGFHLLYPRAVLVRVTAGA
jgi:GNAT superfamily N-acetyltransferase